ncbi:MAG TPA: alpha-E domain-containing protein, partial [Candidatus Polarisedimenticolia bacterium]|nr:alpha-E domain-containing protein [Candidatus Polarisedimenticolia bacterium]
KLPALLTPEPKVDLPLLHTRWRALLRGLSSLENFRQTSGARLEPLEVLHFLLFDPQAPRSLRYGTNAVKDVLDRLSAGGHPSAPARLIGRLAAELTYRSDEVIQRGEYLVFLESVLDGAAKTHEAVSTLYFGT